MSSRILIVVFALFGWLLAPNGYSQITKPLQHIWEVKPDFGDIWHPKSDEVLAYFDVELLGSSSVQERMNVARWICRDPKNSNFQRRERALELLLERLGTQNEPLPVRRAMISAATLLSDGSHAAQLWEWAQADELMRTTVEKSLIGWKSPPALVAWRQRLSDPLAKSTEIAVALDGLAVVGSAEDTTLLQAVLRGNRTSLPNRILAADALGRLNQQGLNQIAQQVLDSNVEQRHLLAAKLICQHTGDQTLAQLRTIFDMGPDVAQQIAVDAMVDRYEQVAYEYVPVWLTHVDSSIRLSALRLLEKFPDEKSLRFEAQLISDRNQTVRRVAGEHLLERAKKGQRDLVEEVAIASLNGEAWTGIEQSLILCVGLRDDKRCAKFVELLDHPRLEVNMHAAWALMELAKDREILEGISKHLEKVTAYLSEHGVSPPLTDSDMIRVSFLHEAIGKNLYEPAHELMLKYVPKNGFQLGKVSRASAIWALGQLNKERDNADLRAKLCERVADVSGLVLPEDYLVRFTCILALGEMGFDDSRETIVKFREALPLPIGFASDWALERIDAKK